MANKHFLNGVIKSEPSRWSNQDCERLLSLKKEGASFEDIGKVFGKTGYACNRKYYKLMKKNDTYNLKHRKTKYLQNLRYLEQVQADSLLDVYSGGVSWWKSNSNLKVIDNDIKKQGADFAMDAYDFLYHHRKQKFDIVDLDPYGSAYDCFDLALQIADKGMIITFGEIVGRRFNRMDFVEHRYDIKYIDEFTTNKLSEYVEQRGLIYRKKLIPIIKAEMTNISRVYYKIEHFDYGVSGCKYFPKRQQPDLFNSIDIIR
jgi:hypothetical protein